MPWMSEGIVNNGQPGDLLADTGVLAIGSQGFTILIWSNVGATIEFVLRNALNTADVNTQKYYNQGSNYIYKLPLNVTLNQRLIVRVIDAYEGDFNVSIMW